MLDLNITLPYGNTTTSVTALNDMLADGNGTLWQPPSVTDYVEYHIARWLLLIHRPVCVGVGITGNVMCMVVVLTTSLRHSPTVVYVVTLAFLDLAICLLGAAGFIRDEILGEGLFFKESWHCKTYFFLFLFVIHFDTLTMVFMTAQRYVAVGFPLHASRWVTKSKAIASLVVAAVISFFANVVHLITLEIQPYDGSYRGRCIAGTGLGKFIQTYIYPWIDFVLYFLFPTVCISIFNILIFRSLKKTDRFKKNAVFTKSSFPIATVSSVQIHQDGGHPPGVYISPKSCHMNSDGSSLSVAVKTTNTSNNSGNSSAMGGNNSAMLTRMLMMVSVAYLVLTLPMGVFVVISRFWNPSGGHDKARFSLLRKIIGILMFTNHAINFVLYCLSGKRFRKKVMTALCSRSVASSRAEGTAGLQ